MRRPQIGIPLTLDDRGRWRTGRHYHYIDRRYADAIDGAGGLALQLPIQSDPEALVQSIDGLLIPGGDDFPADEALPDDVELDLVAREQLAFDEILYDAARRRGLPILGICYGMQLMARRRGGALHADLATQRPGSDDHALPEDARHPITLDRTSILFHLFGSGAATVNSQHHQAVARVGPDHRAVAHAPDGVIEAIEARNDGTGAWELGVQWHPEKMREATSERLFRGFIEACRRPEHAA
jgi:putative glutamine amidotransferase